MRAAPTSPLMLATTPTSEASWPAAEYQPDRVVSQQADDDHVGLL